jgi:hypothetical protein
MVNLARWLPSALPSIFAGSDAAYRQGQVNVTRAANTDALPADLYAVLRAYYLNNALYRELQAQAVDLGLNGADLRSLRNPSQQIVEFYSVHVCPGDLPGALPIVPGPNVPNGDALAAAIHQVWAWSNWSLRKQIVARWLPMLGDVFVKVAVNDRQDRVYFDLIDPAYVTDFETDVRGYLTWIRIDVPQFTRQDDGTYKRWIHSEEWSKANLTYRRWTTARTAQEPLTQLGVPEDERTFEDMGCDDFIPIRHLKFRDLGYLRGVGAYTLLLEKIDEVNRKATNASRALYRAPDETWAITGAAKTDAGFVPPLTIQSDGTVTDSGPVTIGRSRFLSLPPGYDVKSIIPTVNFTALLDGVLHDLRDLQHDAPELLYWETAEGGGVESGTARRMKLAPAVTRVEEVRGTFEAAQADLDMMAVTIAANQGVAGFEGLGEYRKGQLEHTFSKREVIPQTDEEKAQAEVQWATAANSWASAGLPLGEILKRAGYTEEAAAEVLAMATAAVDVQPTGQPAFGQTGGR